MAAGRSKEYWARRALANKARSVNRAEDFLRIQQEKLYRQAGEEIGKEIETLYQRFADQQKISLAEARRLIRDADFKKVDWDGMIRESLDLRRQIREGKGTLPEEVIRNMEAAHKKLEAQIAALSKRGQASWLELRQTEIDRKLLDLYDKQQFNVYDYLSSEYEDGYYRQVYQTQQRIGFGHDFVRPNHEAINKAILNTYRKKDFSSRLYEHCSRFSQDLRSCLATGLIRGENLDKMARRVRDRMGVAYSAAKTLVRTETCYIYEQATLDAYAQCDVEEYEYLATLDDRTTRLCQNLDGKHFKLKDARPGENYPPMHPNCRSTTVAWFPEDAVAKKKETRLAKDKGGTYYEVPADMTYPEWAREQGAPAEMESSKSILRKGTQAIQKLHDNLTDLKEPIPLNKIPFQRTIRRLVEENHSPVAKLLLKHYNEIGVINLHPWGSAAFRDWDGIVGIRVDMEKARRDPRGKFCPLYHEIGHALDRLMGRPSRNPKFRQAILQDAEDIMGAFRETYQDQWQQELKNIYNKQPGKYHSLGDIISGATDGKLSFRYKHDPEYWRKDANRLPSETFAHFCEAQLTGGEKKKGLQESFPRSWMLFEEMIEHGNS